MMYPRDDVSWELQALHTEMLILTKGEAAEGLRRRPVCRRKTSEPGRGGGEVARGGACWVRNEEDGAALQ
jgi:hypothetical protein